MANEIYGWGMQWRQGVALMGMLAAGQIGWVQR